MRTNHPRGDLSYALRRRRPPPPSPTRSRGLPLVGTWCLLSIYNNYDERFLGRMVLGENLVEGGRQNKVQEESRVGGVQNYKLQEENSEVNY